MAFRIVAILSLVIRAHAGSHQYPGIGGYMPVSDVLEHSQIATDVGTFVAALKEDPPNYAKAKHIYSTGGGASCKSSTTGRTLQGFATKDLTGESYADRIYATGLAKDFWDTWFLAGLDGTGAWAKLGETQRTVSLMKGAMGLVTLYASHELEAAIVKAKQDAGRSDAKSGHAWDEGWAFYYGTDGTNAPWEVAKKRDGDFPDGAEVQTAILPHFNKGLIAVRKATYDEDTAVKHMNVIYSMWAVTYMRAALKYLSITEKNYNAKAHAEGYAYWMAIAGWAASYCKDEANAMTDALAITQTSIPAGTYCAAKKKIESCYKKLGISCKLVGSYKDAGTKGVKCVDACVGDDVTIPAGAAAVAGVVGTNKADVTCSAPAPGPKGSVPAPGPEASNAVRSTLALAMFSLTGLMGT